MIGTFHLGSQTDSEIRQIKLLACKRVFGVFIIFILIGCAAFEGYPQRATTPENDLATLKSEIDGTATKQCLDQSDIKCRNRILAARMHATNIRFSEFEETLFRQTRKAGFGSTLATLGLTSAAAVSTGGASQVLSGIAAFIIGGKEAFQKEVLAERTVIAIHTAMRGKRAQVALRIMTRWNQTIDQYPLALALGDLDEYYSAGTVLGALVGITEAVGASTKQAEAALQTTLSFNLDAPAQKFNQAVCRGVVDCPNPDGAKFPEIRACWPGAAVPKETLMLDFIMQPRFASERALVAKCMGL